MPAAKLKEFLDSNKVKYDTIVHAHTITAQETAESAHIPGRKLAKTVMVKLDGKMAMAVLPAHYKVDLDRLKECAGAKTVTMAGENEFKTMFPNCECGAMPPFGNLFGMDVYVATHLAEDDEIAFNAGTHSELIRLAYKDFERLVQPKICNFASAG